ncbi:MAG: hypothetical protein ACR2LF_02865 [Jatrophihabitantaceae bacterium]
MDLVTAFLLAPGLGRREDEDQGPTRVVIWSDGSQADLGVLGVVLVATCICIAGIVMATNNDGIVRVIGDDRRAVCAGDPHSACRLARHRSTGKAIK